MSTFDLHFTKQGRGHPNSAYVYVRLGRYLDWLKKEDGERFTLLTPECVSPAELDEAIDGLIGELEQIRNRGRIKLAKRKTAGNSRLNH
jgi:hypothetical protein